MFRDAGKLWKNQLGGDYLAERVCKELLGGKVYDRIKNEEQGWVVLKKKNAVTVRLHERSMNWSGRGNCVTTRLSRLFPFPKTFIPGIMSTGPTAVGRVLDCD
jgi:hypothetical protein